jgi:hypothetical protein
MEQCPVKIRSDARIDPSSRPAKNLECGLSPAVVPDALDDPDREGRQRRLGEPRGDRFDGRLAVRRDAVSPFDPVVRASPFCACEQSLQVARVVNFIRWHERSVPPS